MDKSTWSRAEKLAVALLTTAFAWLWNWQFVGWCSLPQILKMNDVPGILQGYRQTPHLWPDSLAWWSGSWIQSGIAAFRPLASYLYWIESWVGLHVGFLWVGWIGFALLVGVCWLVSILTWRLTQSKVCVFLSAILAPAIKFTNWNPDHWLAWFPVHQELLLLVFVLGALLCFDAWHQSGERRFLFGAWILFILGCLTKEFVYIFPAFALAIVLLRESPAVIKRRGLQQFCWMSIVVLAFVCYRKAVVPHPRNPPLFEPIDFLHHAFLFLLHPFYMSVLLLDAWMPLLALLIFIICGGWLRWRQTPQGRALLEKRWTSLILGLMAIGIVAIYCAATRPFMDVFWFFFEPKSRGLHLQELGAMIGTIYSVYLLWKYRREEPTALVFAFVVLSYVPAFTFIGWHYTIPGWFFRSAYWPLIGKLVWIDLGRPKFPETTILRKTRTESGNRVLD